MSIETEKSQQSKEKNGNAIFNVRFGFGPHTLDSTDWADILIKDVSEFFTPDPTQRNIFFMENADGREDFLRKFRRGLRTYGKFTLAFIYTIMDPLDVPSASYLTQTYNRVESKALALEMEGVGFQDKLFRGLDEITSRGLVIDFAVETRRDQRERERVKVIAESTETQQVESIEDFRKLVQKFKWLQTIRDLKIGDDLLEMYKKLLEVSKKREFMFHLEGHTQDQQWIQ